MKNKYSNTYNKPYVFLCPPFRIHDKPQWCIQPPVDITQTHIDKTYDYTAMERYINCSETPYSTTWNPITKQCYRGHAI